jgi:hypothetical protein
MNVAHAPFGGMRRYWKTQDRDPTGGRGCGIVAPTPGASSVVADDGTPMTVVSELACAALAGSTVLVSADVSASRPQRVSSERSSNGDGLRERASEAAAATALCARLGRFRLTMVRARVTPSLTRSALRARPAVARRQTRSSDAAASQWKLLMCARGDNVSFQPSVTGERAEGSGVIGVDLA